MAKLFLFVGIFLIVGVVSAFVGALGYVILRAIQQLLAEYQTWVSWLVWGLGSVWVVGASVGIARWVGRRRASPQPAAERQVIMLTPTDATRLFDTWRARLPAPTENATAGPRAATRLASSEQQPAHTRPPRTVRVARAARAGHPRHRVLG